MPRGCYSFHDPHDGAAAGGERFECAAGPAGWRYTSQALDVDGVVCGHTDLTIDTGGRMVRLDVTGGGWRVRGGVVPGSRGSTAIWTRTPADEGRWSRRVGAVQEETEPAVAFTGRSPGYLLAMTRLVALHPRDGALLRLVELAQPVIAARPVDQWWRYLGQREKGIPEQPLPVTCWVVADRATGVSARVYTSGDVLVAAPGVTLEELDGPPTPWAQPSKAAR